MRADTVLVTGASSGLGLDAAVYLATHGFSVYATVRGRQGRAAITQAAQAAGAEISLVELDVTDAAGAQEAVADVERNSGGIYALVNNAGIQIRGCFEDLTDEEIRRVFEVNVFGAMGMTRAVLPGMRRAGRGRLVFLSSIAGYLCSPGLSVYCATKFAVRGFSEALALELKALNIQVSSVAPPIVRTEIWGKNRGVAKGAENPASPYAHAFARSEELTNRMVSNASITPREVSKTVYHALTARRPRMHYVVGTRASWLLAGRKVLPGDWFDRMYMETAARLTRIAESS